MVDIITLINTNSVSWCVLRIASLPLPRYVVRGD